MGATACCYWLPEWRRGDASLCGRGDALLPRHWSTGRRGGAAAAATGMGPGGTWWRGAGVTGGEGRALAASRAVRGGAWGRHGVNRRRGAEHVSRSTGAAGGGGAGRIGVVRPSGCGTRARQVRSPAPEPSLVLWSGSAGSPQAPVSRFRCFPVPSTTHRPSRKLKATGSAFPPRPAPGAAPPVGT